MAETLLVHDTFTGGAGTLVGHSPDTGPSPWVTFPSALFAGSDAHLSGSGTIDGPAGGSAGITAAGIAPTAQHVRWLWDPSTNDEFEMLLRSTSDGGSALIFSVKTDGTFFLWRIGPVGFDEDEHATSGIWVGGGGPITIDARIGGEELWIFKNGILVVHWAYPTGNIDGLKTHAYVGFVTRGVGGTNGTLSEFHLYNW